MKKARQRPRFFIVSAGQLRSAFAFLEDDEDGPAASVVELLPVPDDDDIVPEEPLLLGVLEALEPELIVPEEPAVEAEPLPVVEPCAAAPLPPGVPVVPIGVFCVLRWPAPVAGSAAEDFGGVPCAKARLKVAAAMAAVTSLSDMIRTP
jgi:hypothetical protein